jgi:hypothetical protein
MKHARHVSIEGCRRAYPLGVTPYLNPLNLYRGFLPIICDAYQGIGRGILTLWRRFHAGAFQRAQQMGDDNLCLSAVHAYRITPILARRTRMSTCVNGNPQ